MKVFRYPADRVPTALIVSLTVCDLLVFWLVQSPYLVVAWMLCVVPFKTGSCAFNHHHQHVQTFYKTWLNRLLEVVYGLQTGISTNAWVLHHNLGHHLNYLDQTKDESAWKDEKGNTMGVFRYTMTIALTGYWRAYQVGKRHPRHQKGFLAAGSLIMVLLLALFWVNWFNALVLFLIPMAWGLVETSWHTFYHHAGLDSDDHFHASHNVMHRWYNVFTGNLGYHTAHHVKPGLHWSKLPEYHATIADRIPPELFVEPCIPFRWFPDRSRVTPKTAKLPTELAAGDTVVASENQGALSF